MRKLYRATSTSEFQEMWIGDLSEVPEGWHGSTTAALSAFEPPAELPQPKRRGRPRKSKE